MRPSVSAINVLDGGADADGCSVKVPVHTPSNAAGSRCTWLRTGLSNVGGTIRKRCDADAFARTSSISNS